MSASGVTYDALLRRVRHLAASMERLPLIGISGHGGSGKSTLTTRLISDLGGSPEQVVRTDRFFAPDAGPHSGLFELHDWPTLIMLLRELRSGQATTRLIHPVRTYDGRVRTHDVAMPPVLIVEGIRLIQPEIVPLLDLSIWIAMTPEAAGRRAVARNRAQGDNPVELELWATKWVPEGHAYEASVRPSDLADLVIAPAGPL